MAGGERVRRNRFTDDWSGREATLRDRTEEFAPPKDVSLVESPPDPDTSAIRCGRSAVFVDAVGPAAEVVRTIGDEAEAILARPRSRLS
ncbi:hypothetical protein [Streptomyces sp. NPDC001123]